MLRWAYSFLFLSCFTLHSSADFDPGRINFVDVGLGGTSLGAAMGGTHTMLSAVRESLRTIDDLAKVKEGHKELARFRVQFRDLIELAEATKNKKLLTIDELAEFAHKWSDFNDHELPKLQKYFAHEPKVKPLIGRFTELNKKFHFGLKAGVAGILGSSLYLIYTVINEQASLQVSSTNLDYAPPVRHQQ